MCSPDRDDILGVRCLRLFGGLLMLVNYRLKPWMFTNTFWAHIPKCHVSYHYADDSDDGA